MRHGGDDRLRQGGDGPGPHRRSRRGRRPTRVRRPPRPSSVAGPRGVLPFDRGRRGDHLQAPGRAARAGRPGRVDDEVPQLAGPAVGADHRAVEQQRPGDAGADRQEQRVPGTAGRPEPGLGQQSGAHVVPDDGRHAEQATRPGRGSAGPASRGSPSTGPTPRRLVDQAGDDDPAADQPSRAVVLRRPWPAGRSPPRATTAADVGGDVRRGRRRRRRRRRRRPRSTRAALMRVPPTSTAATTSDTSAMPYSARAGRRQDHRSGQVARVVGVEVALPGLREAEPVHPHELGQRVDVAVLEVRAGRRAPAPPGPPAPRRTPRWPGPAAAMLDRAVPVLHRRVGLGPELGRLAQLEGGLLGQPDGPAAADEGHLLGVGQPGQALRLVLGQHRPGVRDGGRRGPRRATPAAAPAVEVANRVCTTDCSSTSGSRMVRSASSVTGVPGVATIAVVTSVAAAQRREDVDHLGGGAGAGDRQHARRSRGPAGARWPRTRRSRRARPARAARRRPGP